MKILTRLFLIGLLLLLFITPRSIAQIANHIVISQVYGGGGNSGAPYTNDFIELYNPTNSTINLSGWSVQYCPATTASWNGTNLTGSIAPYSYYLVQEYAPSTPNGNAMPTYDDVGTILIATTSGKVILSNSNTLFTIGCPSDPSIIDFVGYGSSANCFEGSGPTSTPSSNNTKSVYRISGSLATNRGSGYDSNDNNNDFVTGNVSPRNSASPSQPPTLSTDFFRSKTSGNWTDATSWESSSSGTTDWLNASIAPDTASNSINILNGHNIIATSNILLDQTTIQSGGILTINPTITLSLNDGVGTDLVINAGGQLKLKSDATGAANFEDIGPATLDQSGNVVHERYLAATSNLSGGRSWRLLTSPLISSTNNSVFYNWQNNGINNGTGIEIWSPSGTGPSGNGFMAGGGAVSIYTYYASNNTYNAVANTTTQSLFDANINNPFLVFVTGAYGSGNITSGASATTLISTGKLITGTQTYNFTPASSSNNLYLLANPYACAIDFDKVYGHSTNISRKFWAIDPYLSNIGNYVTISYVGGVYQSNMPASAQNQFIQNGQAVFVEAASVAPATIQIQESDKKSSASQTTVFRTNGGNTETIRIFLNKVINNNSLLLDGALAVCHQTMNNTLDNVDAVKFSNFNESISLLNGTTKLSIESRQLYEVGDSIKIALSGMQPTNYQLEIQPGNINAPGLSAMLYDNFLNDSLLVSLTNNTIYPFTVSSNAASSNNSRFKILFLGSNPLAIKFIKVNAQKEESHVNIAWTVAEQTGTSYYIIERSVDGKNFSSLGTVNATSQNDYAFTDENPVKGKNYYRIKAIARSNSGIYSNVVTVNMSSKDATISLYPNPMSGNTFQLNISNLENGRYVVHLFSTNGQKVFSKEINYGIGSSIININVSGLAAGIYQLQLIGNNGETIATDKLIKQ